jgi:hypothetical protein
MLRHVQRKYTRKLSKTKRKHACKDEDNKPGWDDTVSNLAKLRETEKERERRLAARKSKHFVRATDASGKNVENEAGVTAAYHLCAEGLDCSELLWVSIGLADAGGWVVACAAVLDLVSSCDL